MNETPIQIQSLITYQPVQRENGPAGRGYLTEAEELALRCNIANALAQFEEECVREKWTVPSEVYAWVRTADFNQRKNTAALRAAAQLPYAAPAGNDAHVASLLMAWYRLDADPQSERGQTTALVRRFYSEIRNITASQN